MKKFSSSLVEDVPLAVLMVSGLVTAVGAALIPQDTSSTYTVEADELLSIDNSLELASREIRQARRMLDEIKGRASGGVTPDTDPPQDDPPSSDDGHASAWDPIAFEQEMLSAERPGYLTMPPLGSGAHTVRLDNSDGQVLEGRRVEMGQFGVIGGGNGPTSDPIKFLKIADCEFTASPSYDGVSKFGIRLYNTIDLLIDGVYFHDFDSDGTNTSEHAYYGNPIGSLTFRNIYAARLGGQMIQVINREEPGSNRDIPDRGENSRVVGGDVLIERFVARDCGLNPGRGSFPVSVRDLGRKGRQFDITIRDGLITSNFPEQLRSGRMVSSTGGIVVQGLGKDHWRNGTVLIENVVIDVTKTDRSLLQVNNCERLIVRGCTFIQRDGYYGDVMVDRNDDKYEGTLPSGDIIFINNTGNVRLRVGGEVVGDISQDYTKITSGTSKRAILRMFPVRRKAG